MLPLTIVCYQGILEVEAGPESVLSAYCLRHLSAGIASSSVGVTVIPCRWRFRCISTNYRDDILMDSPLIVSFINDCWSRTTILGVLVLDFFCVQTLRIPKAWLSLTQLLRRQFLSIFLLSASQQDYSLFTPLKESDLNLNRCTSNRGTPGVGQEKSHDWHSLTFFLLKIDYTFKKQLVWKNIFWEIFCCQIALGLEP